MAKTGGMGLVYMISNERFLLRTSDNVVMVLMVLNGTRFFAFLLCLHSQYWCLLQVVTLIFTSIQALLRNGTNFYALQNTAQKAAGMCLVPLVPLISYTYP